jgi:hypothetical protein
MAGALGIEEELCLASLQRHDGDVDRSANALLGVANPFARGFAEVSSFMYRYILRESCSQFDSLPLTSLTIFRPKDLARYPVPVVAAAASPERRGGGGDASAADAAAGVEVGTEAEAASAERAERFGAEAQRLAAIAAQSARGGFLVGDRVDGQDSQGGWYSAVAIATAPDKVRLHYLGWEERHQEWIAAEAWSARIAPFRSRTQHVWRTAAIMAAAIEEDIETCVSIVQKSHSRFRNQPNEMVKRFYFVDGDAHKTFRAIVEHRSRVPPNPRKVISERAVVLLLVHAARARGGASAPGEKGAAAAAALAAHGERVWAYMHASAASNATRAVLDGADASSALRSSFVRVLRRHGDARSVASWMATLEQIGVTLCRDLASLAPERLFGILPLRDLDAAVRIVEEARSSVSFCYVPSHFTRILLTV